MKSLLLKKILSVSLSVTMLGSAAAVLPVVLPESGIKANATGYWKDFIYENIGNNKVKISGYRGDGGNVYIPSSINGHPVASIGSGVFKNENSIETVTICCDGIEQSAFSGCRKLKTIELCEGVDWIGKYAFADCTSLESVILPSSVKQTGSYAFSGCTNLISVRYQELWETMPDDEYDDEPEISIDSCAFKDCISLEKLTLSSYVSDIADNAFYNCTSLNDITINNGNSYLSVENGLLYNYDKTKLIWVSNSKEKVSILSGVDVIGKSVFNNHNNLISINVNKNNKSYSSFDGVLYDKNKTKVIAVPAGKASVKILPSVKSIEARAFMNCSKLKSIYIPPRVESIGASAFKGCSNLKSISLPFSVNSIGERAFYGCKSLSSATVPKNVSYIGSYAFDYQFDLTIYGTEIQWIEQYDDRESEVILSYAAYYANEYGIEFQDNEQIAVNSVSVCDEALSLDIGRKAYIVPTIYPSSAYNTSVTWKSNNTSVATVKDGIITAVGNGTATITVASNNGKTAQCKVTVGSAAEALSNTSTLSKSSVTAGTSVKISGKASGGTAPYTFNYLYKLSAKSSWNTLSGGFVSDTSKDFKPGKAGTYDIKVIAKDSTGATAEKSLKLTVNEAAAELVNKSRVSATTIYQGKTVTISPTATGGTAPYTYKNYYKLTTKNSWNAFTGNVLKLGKTGAYDLKSVVTDSTGATSEKNFIIKVKTLPESLTNVSFISATAVKTGDTVTITADAASGTAPYTYMYCYKLSTKASWNRITDSFVSDTSKFLKLGKAGEYDVKVIAKDSNGAASEKTFNVTAK